MVMPAHSVPRGVADGRGALRSAEATLLRSVQDAQRARLWYHLRAGYALLLLAAETQGAVAVPPETWPGDSTAATLIFRGLRAAMAGDEVAARRLLHAARAQPARETRTALAYVALLEARIAALSGRWAEVVRLLQPVAAQAVTGERDDYPRSLGGLPPARFLLADAFETLGAPDSAAAYLERMTTDPAAWGQWIGIARPLAQRRPVLLYARMGRLADAERHLTVLERWWDRPDELARRMLDEARAAVRNARGMARPERPRT